MQSYLSTKAGSFNFKISQFMRLTVPLGFAANEKYNTKNLQLNASKKRLDTGGKKQYNYTILKTS